MSSPFDGAGPPYKGSSFRGPIISLIVVIVAVAVIWYAFSLVVDDPGALPQLPGPAASA